jgi:hypothetical protein
MLPGSFADSLREGFIKPPLEARPWVYWFWLSGNITSNGITADLEAMKRVGIGGVLIMEVDQGAPVGPADFMGPRWRGLFQHVHAEARRLGLEVNMNNDAGWNGSGGPWIKPEQAMQEVVWTETDLTGPQHFEGKLQQPEMTSGFYRDITVLAFPAVGAQRIADFESKAAFQRRDRQKPKVSSASRTTIERGGITNLARRMDATGKLTWDVPPGEWTVIRFGHTCTGVENAPAPATGRGLECDKLSKTGIEACFAGMMAKLAADTGIEPGKAKGGLVATHIDSWENGSQNWTARMREEFQQRRGYDLLPFLPVMTGRVVDRAEISERFLWDLRQTISELVIENYAGRMRELAHAAGMRFTAEAYGSPCDAIPYGGQSDEPMGEFWTPGASAIETCRGMASCGHVYGKRIIGAEAFTSADQERWLEHPAILKSHGDLAFCEGINRFVFHRYAMQPWTDGREPGMTMGPWGQHYERTQTWWEWTTPWHTYLARCQHLLRQGLFVADICRVQSEAPPQGFGYHERKGYDWDECGTEVVLSRMSVKDGRIVLPDGMSYRVLALPWSQTMTPRLLRKVKELVQAGATVIGPKPSASPSLSGYPQCDVEVNQLAAELWGDANGTSVKEHPFGKGRVVWSDAPEKVLASLGVPPDFTANQPLRYIHRTAGEAEIYFVANLTPREVTTQCRFRVSGRVPEFWWPDSGRIERANVWEETGGVTRVVVPFEPSGSVFVIFRERARKPESLVLVKRDGKEVLSAKAEPPVKLLVRKAEYGVLDHPTQTRDVTAKVQSKADGGEISFPVKAMAEGDDPAPSEIKTLTVDYEIDGRRVRVKAQDPAMVHLSRKAVNIKVEKARYGLLDDPKRTRDMRAKIQRLADSGETNFKVAVLAEGDDPAFLVVKTLELEYMQDGKLHHLTGTDPEVLDLSPAAVPNKPLVAMRRTGRNRIILEAEASGDYEWETASGKTQRLSVQSVAAPIDVNGPWQVQFKGRSAPAEQKFDHLISWSAHPDAGVKYFSGEATYSTIITVPREVLGKDRRVSLDLGKVAIMAQVKLNGKKLGTLWKPPFVVDISEAVRTGANRLEVQVVNLWPNRLIGDEQLGEDSDRNDNGTLKQWPQWLLDGKPSPTGRFTFTSWRLWKKQEALLESGLLGPVQIKAVRSYAVP